jgi:hypothetical protein
MERQRETRVTRADSDHIQRVAQLISIERGSSRVKQSAVCNNKRLLITSLISQLARGGPTSPSVILDCTVAPAQFSV